MCEMQKLFDGLFKTMSSARANRRSETMKLANELRCCNCCHGKRIIIAAESVKKPASVPQKFEKKVVFFCVALLGLIPIATVYLARHYNHLQTHGSGACASSLFYTSTDCKVIF